MKKIITLLFLVSLAFAPSLSFGQNQTNMYLRGDINSWGTTDAMTYRALGTPNWIVTIQAGSDNSFSGFKFANTTDWSDKDWGRGDVVNFNELTTFYQSGGNGTFIQTNAKYYTFTIKDISSGNSEGYVMETSASPVTFTNVSQLPLATDVSDNDDVTVTVTASAAPCSEEKVYVRYSTDGFANSSLVAVTFPTSSSIGTAVIPKQSAENTVSYYVFSTTVLNPTAGYDLLTINYNNNSGSNYSYTTQYGTTQAGDWDATATWKASTVPSGTNDVIIEHAVTVTNAVSTPAVCNDLTINSAASLTVNTGKALTVNGTLTNNAGNGGLVIESTADGTGSLIGGGGASATINRYLTGYSTTNDSKYHFISSSVAAQSIRPNFVANTPATNVDFYSYDEPTNFWINTKDGNGDWNTSFEDNFIVGKGYLVAYPSAVTKEFVGTLNSYTSASPLVLTCTNTNNNGWNLLGNPFSSALDWNLVTTGYLGDGMDDALYYYDAAAENYRYYIHLSGESGALGSGSQYIPSGQGFMVHAKTSGTKTVTLYNGQQAHSTQAFYKNSNTIDNLLILKINRDGYEDETTVLFYPKATNEFDGSFDAYKLYSYSTQMPQIYSINNDINLAINSLKSIDESPNIKLGYKTQVAGTFEINASGIDSFTSTGDIMLEDALLNTMHDLSSNPSYTFTSEVGTFDNRFILHFGPTGIKDTDLSPNQTQIYSINNTVQVINNQNLKGDITIINLFGQVIANYDLTGDTEQQIDFTAAVGLYIVSVKTNNGYTQAQKVIIN